MLPRALVLTLSVLVIAAGAAVLPGGASAFVRPTLSLNEGAGTTAGSTGSVGFAISFNQTTNDAVKNVSIDLPPGLLINEETDGGACLGAGGPVAACQIGSGYAVIEGAKTPMSLYLVKAPAAADLAGVQLVAGSLSLVGGLTFASSTTLGISPSQYVVHQIAFAGLPASPVLDSMLFTLTGLTLPHSCQASSGMVWASSQLWPVAAHATAPYTVTGCRALSYQPAAKEQIAVKPGSTAATLVLDLTDPPGDSTSSTIKLQVPPNLALNPRMHPCLNGSTCTIGTVTATSPIIPSSQLTGTMTLSGSAREPELGIIFPPPLNLQLDTALSFTHLVLQSLPDIPLSTLKLDFTGDKAGLMFVASCYTAMASGTFTPQSGNTADPINATLSETGCRTKVKKSKPLAWASMSGLRAGTPGVIVKATKGNLSPGIRSLSIALSPGLSFRAGALVPHISKQVLSLSGARLRSARIRGGALVVTFTRATAASTLRIGSPLLVESASLVHLAVAGHARYRHLTVEITDGRGKRTQRKLTAHALS